MPREIVIKRPMLIGLMLLVGGYVAFLVVRSIPDIQREIKIWTM